jgi:hypothetical protein
MPNGTSPWTSTSLARVVGRSAVPGGPPEPRRFRLQPGDGPVPAIALAKADAYWVRIRTPVGGAGGATGRQPSSTTSKSLAVTERNAGFRMLLFQRVSNVPLT